MEDSRGLPQRGGEGELTDPLSRYSYKCGKRMSEDSLGQGWREHGKTTLYMFAVVVVVVVVI